MVFIRHIDGTEVGEFSNDEFHAKALAGDFSAEHYYWYEGMKDWRPVSEYRPLAKTQRISFAPPARATVKINREVDADSSSPRKGAISQFLKRLRRRVPRA